MLQWFLGRKSDKLSSLEEPLSTQKAMKTSLDKLPSLKEPLFTQKVVVSSSGKGDYFDHQVIDFTELNLEKKKSLLNARGPIEVLHHPNKEPGCKRYLVSYVNSEENSGTWKEKGEDSVDPPTLDIDRKKTDSIVFSILEKFLQRSEMGMQKYGTNLDRTDLNVLDWINHAQEEHMDAILYLEKLKTILVKSDAFK